MKQIFDTLIKLAIILGGAYGIYHFYNNNTSEKKSASPRYIENDQDYSELEDESTSLKTDNCQRHINNEIRQACIDAQTQ